MGPFPSKGEQGKWASFFKHFSFIGLRDNRSYMLTDEMGLSSKYLGFDIACLLPKYFKEEKIVLPALDNNTIGISLCSFAKDSFQMGLEQCLLAFFKRGKRCEIIKLFVFKGGESGDKKISEEFAAELYKYGYKCEVIDYETPFSVIQNMCMCNLIISTRLHAGIFAYSFNVPFLMFEYEGKCTDFLNEIEKADKCRIKNLSTEDLEKAYENLWSEKETLKRLDEMVDVVEQSFIALKESVYGG